MAYIPEWKRGCFHRQWFPERVLLQVNCWQIHCQSKAPQAARTICTGFEKCFICAKLPHHVYLLRGLHKKLDHLSPTRKQTFGRSMNAPSEFMGMKSIDFLSKIRPLFPYLGRNFDSAVCILEKGAETCQEHWITQSSLAANSEILNTCISASPSLTSISVFKETLLCFGKNQAFKVIRRCYSGFLGTVHWYGTVDLKSMREGTPEHPARTCTLEEEEGTNCWVAAYCIRGGPVKEKATMEYLERRECEYDQKSFVDFYKVSQVNTIFLIISFLLAFSLIENA
ncbi:hypothetical protein ACS0TY_002470 [Phlomoides rotata]